MGLGGERREVGHDTNIPARRVGYDGIQGPDGLAGLPQRLLEKNHPRAAEIARAIGDFFREGLGQGEGLKYQVFSRDDQDGRK